MQRAWWAVVAAVVLACGGPEGALPAGPGSPSGTMTPPENEPVDSAESLWPLTQSSTWVYRITEPGKPPFEKKVEVLGEQPLPGMGDAKAVTVRSVQPHLEELSWQIDADGIVYRVREEDRKNGALARVMTWDPTVIKALSRPMPQGWKNSATTIERERDGSGALVDEKEKVFTWIVEAVDQEVVTPAGTFTNAVKLRRARDDKDSWQPREYWLVPGVGKVLEHGERTEELLRYDVK